MDQIKKYFQMTQSCTDETNGIGFPRRYKIQPCTDQTNKVFPGATITYGPNNVHLDAATMFGLTD